MNKQVTAVQIRSTLDILERHRIGYHGNILLGLDGESYDDIMGELAEMPRQYNVFPVLVQPFIGTQYRHRSITPEQSAFLNGAFTQYAENRGMSCYPTA